MDMKVVDSTVNAQHRVNGCGQGRNEVEVVGDVGEAFSLSLSLSLSDWDRRRSAEPRRIPITLYTDRVRNTMDETTSATCTTLQSNTGLVRASLAAHSSS